MLALNISELKKSYKGGLIALNNISLQIQEGDFFALLGPNGAGKSTLINIISSLTDKDSGIVKVFEKNIDIHKSEAKMFIGLVPQEFNFSPFEKPIDILVNQAGYYGIKRSLAIEKANTYLKLLDIWHKKDTQARFLSGGMKRRLMIARGMMHNPKILMLDEPTAGVDIEVRHQIWRFLKTLNKEHGVTIILTTHYLEEAEHLCNNLVIIHNGNIIKHCSMDEVLQNSAQTSYIAEIKKTNKTHIQVEEAEVTIQDPTHIHISQSNEIPISKIINSLSSHGIIVTKLNNEPNKLENLFLKLTGKSI